MIIAIYSLQGIVDTGIALVVLTAMCFIPASFTIYAIHERIHQEKQLQHMYGVGTMLYWCTMLFWDMVIIVLDIIIKHDKNSKFSI